MLWLLQKKSTSIVVLTVTPSDTSMLQLKALQMLFLVQAPRLGSAVIVSIAAQVVVDCC